MKRILTLAALAASFLATTANATPIRFEFSGTTWSGELATGVFEIETDGTTELFFVYPPPSPIERTFSDLHGANNRPIPWTGSLAVGADTFRFGDFPAGGYSGFRAYDGCTPECEPFRQDTWNLSLYEQSYPFPFGPAPSVFSMRSMSFSSSFFTDTFELSQMTPESIMTMPLGNMYGYFYEDVYDCSGVECVSSRAHDIQFVVDRVVRTTGASTGVPEPGTLGLLGVALAGMVFMRRRTRTRPALLNAAS